MDLVKILKKGGVGVIPTDTLYGVVGSAFSKKTVERIYKVRGRDPKKPCIILISSIHDLQKFGISPELIRANKSMLEKVWPGKVSIVLPVEKKSQKKITYLHRGVESLAFRFPNKKALIAILKKTGPLVAPSANKEGFPPALTISDAKKYFGDTIDFYMSAGTRKSKPSKIISLVTGVPVVLRP